MERLTTTWNDGSFDTFDPIDIVDNEYSKINFQNVLKKLAEYEDAEEQGLLLRLPCKYNDDLYWIINGYAQKVCFKGIKCDKGYKPQIIARYVDGSTLNLKETPIALLENIGRTVFLTKEEAEQKLAEMKGE